MARRFPPPWRAETIPGGYVVRDANGQAFVWVYSRDSEAEAMQAKVLTLRAHIEGGEQRIERGPKGPVVSQYKGARSGTTHSRKTRKTHPRGG
jgi:hypothetical protein